MVCAASSKTANATATPYSDLAVHLVDRQYADLGCDRWNSRHVLVLIAKLGDTPAVFAARLRLKIKDFERRVETDCWTKQDGLILTVLEREIDFLRGGTTPRPLMQL
jgi:hypothetical protein